MALLSRGWKTFPNGGAGAVLIVLVPGDWRLLVLALLLRDIITDLNLGSYITTNRFGGWFTSWLASDGTFLHGYFLGSDARDQDTTSSRLLPAVFDGNWRTMLSFGVVAFNLGNLMTIDVRNVEAMLLGDWTTLSLVFLLAVGSWDICTPPSRQCHKPARGHHDSSLWEPGDIPASELGGILALEHRGIALRIQPSGKLSCRQCHTLGHKLCHTLPRRKSHTCDGTQSCIPSLELCDTSCH